MPQTRLSQSTDQVATAAIWLLLLKEGGRWSAADIAAQLSDDKTLVAQNLVTMSRSGLLVRYEPTPQNKRVQYGVTGYCRVPRSVNLADINATGAVFPEAV